MEKNIMITEIEKTLKKFADFEKEMEEIGEDE